MSQAKQTLFWNVSLHGQVLARLQLPPQFGGNVDLAVEAAMTADHSGTWTAVKDPSLKLDIKDDTALESVAVLSCRPAGAHSWDVVLEAKANIRTIAVVEAATAHEAKGFAELESLPEKWQIFGENPVESDGVTIATGEVLESVFAASATPTSQLNT